MNLGSFVVWLLIAGGMKRGGQQPVGSHCPPFQAGGRRRRDGGRSECQSATGLESSATEIHGAVHTNNCLGSAPDWSVSKYFSQFI